jgi:hypothetical protein
MGISSLHGAKWQNVNDDNRKVYLTNAYRVPMTRPRQPIVIHIPGVDFDDATRPASFYGGPSNLEIGLMII